MSIGAGAVGAIKFERFLPPESPQFQSRTSRPFGCLKAKLLRPHLEFESRERKKNWRELLTGILKIDFEGIKGLRTFEEMMAEVDSKSEGRILDEADAILRGIHLDTRKTHLPPDFTVMGFLKEGPPERVDPEGINFNTPEVLYRTFGAVIALVDTGTRYFLLPKHRQLFEQRFIEGYTFLRAAEILSRQI
jgi:hypothetical protein